MERIKLEKKPGLNVKEALRFAAKGLPGFSLIEIMVVLALIGLLIGGAAVYFMGRLEAGKIDIARNQAYDYEKSLDLYKLQHGNYPSTTEGLQALVNSSKGPPIMERLSKDPWGNDYQYAIPGVKNPHKFDVWSKGPSGGENPEDAIGNWPKE